MKKPQVLDAHHSFLQLPGNSDVRRLPRAPKRRRPEKFTHSFEDRALVYDVFWHQNGEQILLVCPPPMNLLDHWQAASFIARPSGRILAPDFHIARSSMIVALDGAPNDTSELEMVFADQKFVVPVQLNLAHKLDNARVLFTMNKDNPLNWISEWARFHQVMHNANAVILFDNGSTTYSSADIGETLARVPGLTNVIIMSWPYKFGAFDPGVVMNPYWAHFLQNAGFSEVLRRLAGRAFGLLNLDIDELAAPLAGTDVFSAVHDSSSGFHILSGRWVENIITGNGAAQGSIHADFHHVLRDPRHRLNAKKWALDPRRPWLADLDLQPSWHKIKHMPPELVQSASSSNYWHFKAINTNWKQNRSPGRKPSFLYRRSPELIAMFDVYAKEKNSVTGSNKGPD